MITLEPFWDRSGTFPDAAGTAALLHLRRIHSGMAEAEERKKGKAA